MIEAGVHFIKKFLLCFIVLAMTNTAQAATVLIYHHVSTSMPASTSISPEHFIAHMDYLASHHFNIVPLSELTEKLQKNESLPDKTIAITFDDSYEDVYTSAYPILKKRGWPFTFFVNTESVGAGKLFVTWDQLREMSKNGVTIANHTTKHNHMVRLSNGESITQWRARVESEITGAQEKIIQEIGAAPKIFAYPFGEYNSELKNLLKNLGYIAFTQQAGVLNVNTDKQTLPRFPFGGSYTEIADFQEKVNTLSMPVTRVEFYQNKHQQMSDMIVKEGDKPYLVLSLNDSALLPKINCFGSSEGKINTEIIDGKLWVQTTKVFPQGRTKINCTAASAEPSRYYWYTQLWLVTDSNGKWGYQD